MESKGSFFREDVLKAVRCLKNGGVILYPTDTVWGLGCDATNPIAVKKIFDIKQRADEKSMLVLVDSVESLRNIVEEIPQTALSLIEETENPLTIIYDNPRNVARNLIASDGSLGVRITKEPFSGMLCKSFNNPIVSTSANISGQETPRIFKEISPEIKRMVDYIVNYRQNDDTTSMPSNIVKISGNGELKILR